MEGSKMKQNPGKAMWVGSYSRGSALRAGRAASTIGAPFAGAKSSKGAKSVPGTPHGEQDGQGHQAFLQRQQWGGRAVEAVGRGETPKEEVPSKRSTLVFPWLQGGEYRVVLQPRLWRRRSGHSEQRKAGAERCQFLRSAASRRGNPRGAGPGRGRQGARWGRL